MDDARLSELRRVAADFRSAIERSRAEHASPVLPYFPDGACRLVSRLFALHLRRREAWGAEPFRFVSGHVPGQESYVRHTWLLVGEAVVDLTADPFGEAPVIVGGSTPFHDALDGREDQSVESVLAELSTEEIRRLDRLLVPIEARLAAFIPRAGSG